MLFILKLIGILIFSVVGIVGLLASLCGGLFLPSSLFSLEKIALSVGALIAGFLVARYSFRVVGSMIASERAAPDMDAEYPTGDQSSDADAFSNTVPEAPPGVAHQHESPEAKPESKRGLRDSE